MWKSRVIFGFSLLLSLLFIAIYESQPFGFLLLYVLILLFILSLFSILFANASLSIEESIAKEIIEKKEVLHFTSTIENNSIFPYFCTSQEYYSDHFFRGFGPVEKNLISPLKGISEEFSLSFPYRGCYDIGIKEVVVTDFLCLFRRRLSPKNPQKIIVLPTADKRFYEYVDGQMESGNQRNSFNEDYTTIEDIRAYASGDNLKKIHWKLSAKWGQLMVKNYHTISGSNTILFLDTKVLAIDEKKRPAFEDTVISFVASAVDYYALERIPAQLIYGVMPLETVEIRSLEEQETMYRVLASVEFKHPETLVPHYYNSVQQGVKPQLIYFFLFDISPEELKGLALFLASGHNASIYYFYSEDLPLSSLQKDLLSNLELQGIPIYKIEVGAKYEA